VWVHGPSAVIDRLVAAMESTLRILGAVLLYTGAAIQGGTGARALVTGRTRSREARHFRSVRHFGLSTVWRSAAYVLAATGSLLRGWSAAFLIWLGVAILFGSIIEAKTGRRKHEPERAITDEPD
jgi:hypothetical protein